MLVLKKHDTLPWLSAALKQGDGSPIDLSTAVHLKFLAKLKGGTKTMNKEVVLVDPEEGLVMVVWNSIDTDTEGTFDCEFEINWGPGAIQTVPNDGYFNIQIVVDLG